MEAAPSERTASVLLAASFLLALYATAYSGKSRPLPAVVGPGADDVVSAFGSCAADVRQASVREQHVGVIDGECRIGSGDGVFEDVGGGRVVGRPLVRHALVSDADQWHERTQEGLHQRELAALLLLFFRARVGNALGHGAHVRDALPAAAHHGTDFSGESSEDSLFDCTHDTMF